jgi:exodeoxyribonuclease X
MVGWTRLTYLVVAVEGNGHQPPDLMEPAAVPIVSGIIGEPTTWLVQPITYFATFMTVRPECRRSIRDLSAAHAR